MFRVMSLAFACAFASGIFALTPASAGSGFIGTPQKVFFGRSKSFVRPGKFFFGRKGFPVLPPPSTPGTPPPPAPPNLTNVRAFGAKGDGITDDTVAITNAAQDAFANHRTLYFPAGTYVHGALVTFSSIAVTGDGPATVLKATHQTNSAVVLTGLTPSVQNITISTTALPPGIYASIPSAATLLVQNCAQFSVSNCTFVEGPGRAGLHVTSTIGGTISSSVFNGAGAARDTGIFIFDAGYLNVVQNLFQNQDVGIFIRAAEPRKPCVRLFIAGNTIGNITYPTRSFGIDDERSDFITIQGNVIQMANNEENTAGLQVGGETNLSVVSNTIYGGYVGISNTLNVGPSVISQNTIVNSGLAGLRIITLNTNTGLTASSNTFGECGLQPAVGLTNSVILVFGPELNNPNSVAVTNNVYTGHTNHLKYFIQSRVSLPNVTGNRQTQTMLPNSIP